MNVAETGLRILVLNQLTSLNIPLIDKFQFSIYKTQQIHDNSITRLNYENH